MEHALAGSNRPHYVSGFYTGDGTAARCITLGFKPRAVIILGDSILAFKDSVTNIVISRISSYSSFPTAKTRLATEDGFQIGTDEGASVSYSTNVNARMYTYIALR